LAKQTRDKDNDGTPVAITDTRYCRSNVSGLEGLGDVCAAAARMVHTSERKKIVEWEVSDDTVWHHLPIANDTIEHSIPNHTVVAVQIKTVISVYGCFCY
jgi:hypothetical protein